VLASACGQCEWSVVVESDAAPRPLSNNRTALAPPPREWTGGTA
jgi:hypothetical protein